MRKLQLIALFALLAATGCRKEKASYSTVPEETADTPVAADGRPEILSAVFTFLDHSNPGKLLVHDHSGNLVKEVVTPHAPANFQRWFINNRYYYSYLQFDPATYRIPNIGYVPGPVVLLDGDLNEIRRISLLPHGGRTASDPNALDLHEFILLDENHYIVMAYYRTPVNNIPSSLDPHPNVTVVDNIIQEVKNGQVVFEWHSIDYPEFYNSSVEGNNYSDSMNAQDYLHVNSIFIDPADNNFIISARNTNQVFKISRHSGDVIWRLGGTNSNFPLTSDQEFLRQHHATVTKDNTLMIFDNGEVGLRPYSRVVEFDLDVVGKSVRTFKAIYLPGNYFCAYMGSVQMREHSYFIGCGSQPRILELSSTSLKVLMDMPLERPSYRSYKYD